MTNNSLDAIVELDHSAVDDAELAPADPGPELHLIRRSIGRSIIVILDQI